MGGHWSGSVDGRNQASFFDDSALLELESLLEDEVDSDLEAASVVPLVPFVAAALGSVFGAV
jgi:hypothetical protein